MTIRARLPATRPRSASITATTGELVLLTGPMFAGKSAALIAHARAARDGLPWPGHAPAGTGPRAEPAARTVLVLKPAFDVRDGADVLSSRDGSRIAALPVSCWPPQARGHDVVVIDEVQFMVTPHYAGDIVADVAAAVKAGQQVVAGGLDTDYARRPFEPVARLAEQADRHLRLLARCHVCDAPAGWTAKREETGRRLELGLEGLYEARCDAHWSLPATPTPATPTPAAPTPAGCATSIAGVGS